MSIDDPRNKQKIAIIAVGYDRLSSMKRLLTSLQNAVYPSDVDIPLVISIDCSGNSELYSYVNNFKWENGEKYVVIHEKRLGLKNHIFKCGDMSKLFKAIVLFEDDLYSSKYFYYYVKQTVDYYYDDSNIAQISLYNNEMNGYVGLPFKPLYNGFDVYASQDVSTWGECWTDRMWDEFCRWKDCNQNIDLEAMEIPEEVKTWKNAWSVYFIAYIVSTHKYILTPYVSLSTNFNDAGTHNLSGNSFVQVCLLDGKCQFRLGPFDSLIKYDVFYNNLMTYKWLDMGIEELSLDYYNFRGRKHNRYLLSSGRMPYKVIRSYGSQLRPIELNVREKIAGCSLFLYDTEYENSNIKNSGYSAYFIEYYLHGFSVKLLTVYVLGFFRGKIVNKIKRAFTFYLKRNK